MFGVGMSGGQKFVGISGSVGGRKKMMGGGWHVLGNGLGVGQRLVG